MKDDKGKKGLLFRDIIVIVLCIIALVALVFILKRYNDNTKLAQEQLSEISNQIQQGELDLSVSASSGSSSNKGIYINEINQEGWVELYNSDSEINLGGYSILVDGEVVKTIDEDTIIDRKSLLVLEIGSTLEAGQRHIVTIIDNDNEIVKAAIIPALEKSQSYGCVSEESLEMSYLTVSKGEINDGCEVSDVSELTFSVPGGFYSSVVNLEISAPEGMNIYYTLDGSNPTTESTQYDGSSITIENKSGSGYTYALNETNGYTPSSIYMGTVVRAIAVDSKNNVKWEKTESYYIGIGSNSDLADIPVISITTDPENLFNYYEGIYVKGRKYGDAKAIADGSVGANYYEYWYRTAHIEYYESNKDKTYEGDVELFVLKDYSVTAPQKSIKVSGDGAWAGSGLEQYFNSVSKTFSLQTNKRDNDSKVRDYLAHKLLEETMVGTAKLTPCIVFIDGEYWGLYTIRQSYDARYFEEYYGITDTEIILSKEGNNEEYNEFYDYITTLDMSQEENYQWAKDNMDIQSYLDYFCANMYLANVDYGIEEAYTWKTKEVGTSPYADGKWRWIAGKLDYAMNNSNANGAAASDIDTFLQAGVREDALFRALLVNDEFRSQLKETMQNMADNVFTSDKVADKLSELSDLLSKPAIGSYERFYGSTSTSFYSSLTNSIQSFFDERASYILTYTQEIDEIEARYEEYELKEDEYEDNEIEEEEEESDGQN